MKLPYNKDALCHVKNHGAKGEIAAICTRCFDAALRWQAYQVREEQKAEHLRWLASFERKAA